MKRIYVLLLLMTAFIFSAFMSEEDYCAAQDEEQGKSGSLTCATCHTLDINDVIVDEDGKDEEELDEDEDGKPDKIIFSVDVSNFNGLVQLAVDAQNVSIKGQDELIKGDVGILFEAVQYAYDANQKGKKEENIELVYHYPENFVEPTVITLQGVVADGDGTTAGDYSFKKELTIFPPKVDFSILPSVASTYIELNELNEGSNISIINIIGKTVLNTKLDASKKIEVSHLEKGSYFLVTGYGYNQQTQQFVVSK
ncbi:MAG: T9SS type A sorting domain-containing protein [Chitinophagales bacterium]